MRTWLPGWIVQKQEGKEPSKEQKGKKKDRVRLIRRIARGSEEVDPEGRRRDPLSYGHIRDFFGLYLLALVTRKGHSALLNWAT